MADKPNATCSICGKGYHKCLSCADKIKAEPWKQYVCCSEHYKVFQIVRGYNTGVYTKGEAKERLQTVDLSDLDSFKDNIRKIVKDIMKEEKKVAKVEEPVVVAEASVVEAEVAQTPYVSRRKKYSERVEAETEVAAE